MPLEGSGSIRFETNSSNKRTEQNVIISHPLVDDQSIASQMETEKPKLGRMGMVVPWLLSGL